MIKVIEGKNAILGRLAAFVAKEILKGEEIAIVNCDEVVITGNQKSIQEEFDAMRDRVGHGQRGPVHHKDTEKIVKRAIRGMLPNHRFGRGREAFKRVKCYRKVPTEFKDSKVIDLKFQEKQKGNKLKEFLH
jgi:ribosomal protein uL13